MALIKNIGIANLLRDYALYLKSDYGFSDDRVRTLIYCAESLEEGEKPIGEQRDLMEVEKRRMILSFREIKQSLPQFKEETEVGPSV